MSWLTQIVAVTLAQPADDPAAARLVGRRDRRHRRRRDRVRVGAVDRRRASPPRCTAAGSPDRALVMRSGADGEMTSGLGGPEADIIKQAPGLRRDGQRAARVGRAVRPHRPAEEVDRHAGQRADARHRAGDASACARKRRSSRAGCCSSAPTRSSSAAPRRASSPASTVGSEIKAGQNTWTVVGIFESRRQRGRNRDLVRRADPAGRVPPRQQLPVGAARGSSRRSRSTRSRTG